MLILKNCDFINNSLNSSSNNGLKGNIIYCSSGWLKIENCNFINNTATSTVSSFMQGALINSMHTTVDIINSSFINNTANHKSLIHGGIINSFASLRVFNSKFINNNATKGCQGGVIYDEGDVSIINSTFINNSAQVGGSLHIINGVLVNSTFINGTDNVGKEIYATKVVVYNCLFNNTSDPSKEIRGSYIVKNSTKENLTTIIQNKIDSASQNAEIFLENKTYSSITPIIINKNLTIYGGSSKEDNKKSLIDGQGMVKIIEIAPNCTVKLININFINAYSNYGGAVYIGFNSNVTIINSKFDKCYALYNGGGVYLAYNSTSTIINSTFTNNLITKGGNGAAIHIKSYAYLNLINSTIRNNYLTYGEVGGALTCAANSFLNITNTLFEGNHANSGGAIRFYANVTANIKDSTFKNNYNSGSNNGYAGAIFVGNNCALTINNTNFLNNRNTGAIAMGGAIYICNSTVIINNSNFTGSTNKYMGGVIYTESNSTLIIIKSNFNKNEADTGIIYLESNVKTLIKDSNFNNSKAALGTVIYTSSNLTLINVTISNAEANRYGIIYLNNCSIDMINSTMLNTSSDYYGAGIYFYGSFDNYETITIINSKFDKNNCTYGVVYGFVKYATVTNSTFTNNPNFAINVIYNLAVKNSTFINNRLGITCSEMSVENSIFNNHSNYAIKVNGNLNITNSTFINNYATYTGAGICADYSTKLNVTNCRFENNTAHYGGGAISVENNCTLIIYNSTFTNNKAGYVESKSTGGGAIYSSAYASSLIKISIYNSIFTQNYGEYYGGALSIGGYKNKVNINNTFFTNNTAKYGGAIAVKTEEKNVTISNSSFIDNYAEQGNAIHSYGSLKKAPQIYLNLTNLNFEDKSENGTTLYFVKSFVNLTNNTIKTKAIPIYLNESSITSPTFIIFNNITAPLGSEVVLSGIIKDDKNNTIGSQKDILGTINNTGSYNFTFNPTTSNFEYVHTPTTLGEFLILGNHSEVTNSKIIGGKLIIAKGELNDDKINITIHNSTCNNFTGTIKLPENANGTITILVNNTPYKTITLENGTADFNINNLTTGLKNITIIYSGNQLYNQTIKNITTLIERGYNSIDITTSVNKGEVEINVKLLSNTTGKLVFELNDKKYEVKINGTTANLKINYLANGNYTIKCSLESPDYNPISLNKSFIVTDAVEPIIVTANNLTMYYHDGSEFVVKVTDKNGKALKNIKLEISLNNAKYIRITNNNGIASLKINLNSGLYKVIVTVDGGKTYENKTIISYINVKSSIITNDVVKIVRNDTHYSATFLTKSGVPLINSKVTFNIHGVIYTKTTDNKGMAKLNINLDVGTYTLTAISPNGEMASSTITVLPNMIGSNLTKYYKNSSQYYVTLLDKQGKPQAYKEVIINIHGVFYKCLSDKNGVARLNINLDVGSYILTASYNNCNISNNITVLSTIQTENLIMHNTHRVPFKVTVLNSKGKPAPHMTVKFNVNGMIYTKISNSNGIAILNINLPIGIYIITTEYNGQMQSNTIAIKE